MDIARQRDLSIDIAKGIAIILVVFGHTFQIYSVTSYVYAFHMPLFFLLAGHTFDMQKYRENPGHFLKRYFLRLIVPYFCAAICSYLIYSYLAPILSLPNISVSAAVKGILKGNGIDLPFNNILWFLPAFFCSKVIFLALGFILKGARLFIGVIIISFIGILIGVSHHLPFGLDIAMTTQFFIYCGYIFQKAEWLEKIKGSKSRSVLNYIAIVSLIVMLVFSSMNGRTDLMIRLYGQPVLFFIAGLSGSISVLMISLFFYIKGRHHPIARILEAPGKASMYIFISYIPIAYGFASAFALLWGFWIYYTFKTYWYLLFIIGVSIPTSVHILIVFLRKKIVKKGVKLL